MSTPDPNPHQDRSRPRAGAWRQEVRGRAERLRDASVTVPSQVAQRLTWAESIADDRTSLREWWSGSHIEAAWLELRLAEEAQIRLLPDDEASIKPAAERALQHAIVHLPADHQLAKSLSADLNAANPNWQLVKQAALDLTVAAHEASDQQQQLMRSFRNQLMGLVMVLILLAVVGCVMVAALPENLTDGLLPAPAGLSADAAVLFAIAMGSVGALFSAVPSLAQTPTVEAAFNPIRVQAMLKVVVGAWSGVIGLMVVEAGMAGATASSTATQAGAQASTMAGFAVMAALFGSSQEALTRFADHRAGATAGTP